VEVENFDCVWMNEDYLCQSRLDPDEQFGGPAEPLEFYRRTLKSFTKYPHRLLFDGI
jgi:hypothetical protein